MPINRSRVISSAVHVFIAKRTDSSTPVAHAGVDFDPYEAGWRDIGSVEKKSSKITPEKHMAADQVGEFQLGVTQKFETNALEVDAAQVALLEDMMNDVCDVILYFVGGGGKAIKLLGQTVSFGYDGEFDNTSPMKLTLEAKAFGSKPSALITHLTGLTWDETDLVAP